MDEKKLSGVVSEIDKLLLMREEIIANSKLQDIAATEKLDNEISQLKIQKKELESSVKNSQEKLVAYQKSINKKGDI